MSPNSTPIAPDGSLALWPNSEESRRLGMQYGHIQALESGGQGLFGALTVLGAGHGPCALRRQTVASCRVPGRLLGSFHPQFPAWAGTWGMAHREALYAILSSCVGETPIHPSALPGFLRSAPGRYTHLLMRPETRRECEEAMGAGAPRFDYGLRRGQSLRGLNFAEGLEVIEDYAVPARTVLCVNSRSLAMVVGGGLVSYDHDACVFSISRLFELLQVGGPATRVALR